jgi:hypothetical protein
MEDGDLAVPGGRGQVARERGDAAAARGIGCDERRSDDDRLQVVEKEAATPP